MLKGDGYCIIDTFESWRGMVPINSIHFSWKIHRKQGQWHHVSVQEQNALVWLHAVKEAIGSSQIEGLIQVTELMHWVKLGSQIIRLVIGVHICLKCLP